MTNSDDVALRGEMLRVRHNDAVGILYVRQKRPGQFPQGLVHWGAPLIVTVSVCARHQWGPGRLYENAPWLHRIASFERAIERYDTCRNLRRRAG